MNLSNHVYCEGGLFLSNLFDAENATEYQLCAVFGWKNPDEARPYIESANKLKQARIAMKQVNMSENFDRNMSENLKTYINQGLMAKMATPRRIELLFSG